uniref:Uncharacterized protein n=1 Tax=Oryza nivara TaxID=4536 RepID=A0A0E0I9Q9_ORYNI
MSPIGAAEARRRRCHEVSCPLRRYHCCRYRHFPRDTAHRHQGPPTATKGHRLLPFSGESGTKSKHSQFSDIFTKAIGDPSHKPLPSQPKTLIRMSHVGVGGITDAREDMKLVEVGGEETHALILTQIQRSTIYMISFPNLCRMPFSKSVK